MKRPVKKFQRYGYLFTLQRLPQSKDYKARWLCWCECGNLAIVRADNLTQTATTGRKNTVSCGCVRKIVGKVRMAAVASAYWAGRNT
jgi:hypothetical protein